jgi:uncharacterized protein YecT (DUF1311 family)
LAAQLSMSYVPDEAAALISGQHIRTLDFAKGVHAFDSSMQTWEDKLDTTSSGARSVFALLCFLLAGHAHAGSDCSTTEGHADQRRCLERAAHATRVKLEKAQGLLVERIRAWDAEPDDRQRAVTLLKQSFTHFAAFRDADCEYHAAAAAGGNGAGDRRLQCRIDLDSQYAASLGKQLAWYPPR